MARNCDDWETNNHPKKHQIKDIRYTNKSICRNSVSELYTFKGLWRIFNARQVKAQDRKKLWVERHCLGKTISTLEYVFIMNCSRRVGFITFNYKGKLNTILGNIIAAWEYEWTVFCQTLSIVLYDPVLKFDMTLSHEIICDQPLKTVLPPV